MKKINLKIVISAFLSCFFVIAGVAWAIDECRGCHPLEVESFALTAHSESGECLICHGDASKHLNNAEKKGSILNPANIGFKKANKVCISCHEEKDRDVSQRFLMVANLHDDLNCYECHAPHLPAGVGHPDTSENLEEDLSLFKADLSVNCSTCHQREADDFVDSEHGLADLRCADCHKLHKMRTISQDIEEQIETCLSCHTAQELEFKYPYTHPLRERQIKCTDCHNPHSSRYDKMLKKDGDRVCKDCHADVVIKSGKHPESKGTNHPFRTVECLDCHRPHGSNFNKLLKHSINTICNTCHN